MSIEAKVHLNPEFSPDQIMDFLETVVNILDVHIDWKLGVDFIVIDCSPKLDDIPRRFYLHASRGLFGSHLLVGNDSVENASEVLEKVVDHFGGLYETDANEDVATIYEGKWHTGDGSVFTHKWAFAKNLVDGVTLDDAKEADRIFREKHRQSGVFKKG